MEYVPNVSVEDWSEEGVLASCHEALEAAWSRDARFRNTGVGPHRDELLLSLTGGAHPTEVREFGSGGQRRTAALALRLVEGDCIRRTRGTQPILLLDDAFAELDEARRERVIGLMDSGRFGQVILTAPKESDVPLQGDGLPRWGIRDGRVCA
jgi:DNA replication and repair protein RecF